MFDFDYSLIADDAPIIAREMAERAEFGLPLDPRLAKISVIALLEHEWFCHYYPSTVARDAAIRFVVANQDQVWSHANPAWMARDAFLESEGVEF